MITAVTVMVFGTLPIVRYEIRKLRSGNWPVTQATVQKGEILPKGATKFMYVPWRSLLGYAYEVSGQSYWGYFVLAAEDASSAEQLQRAADGKAVTIRYDPKNPKTSFLAESD
ncbi:MAG TPA: DUF3592 domain-containing protein, partial [Verrucomicrobiae bacterium]